MSYSDVTHTAGEIATHVKRQFGDEAAIQISDADIFRWINQGQTEIFQRAEPIKASAVANTVAQQAQYTFPTDVMRVQSILVNGIPVKQVSTQEAEEYVLQYDPNSIINGQPEIWYEWGGTFTFYPRPEYSTTDAITIKYVKKPVDVTAGADLLSIPDAFYNRLVEYVLQQAYELDENFTASEMKGNQFTQNLETYTNRDSVTRNTYPTITVLDEDL